LYTHFVKNFSKSGYEKAKLPNPVP
jgi:hypothetical protein